MKPARLSRNQLAWRAAQDLEEGTYVNLGMGVPVLSANYAPAGREIIFHSENGIVGVGPVATGNAVDPNLVDAGAQKVTLRPGAAIVDSAASFAMIRGGHIDVTMLGAFQVSRAGDLANWDAMVPNKGKLIGGAMDLAFGAKEVRVVMSHVTKEGEPRLVDVCTYPLTAPGVVRRVYTDLAVVDVTDDGFLVREMVEGIDRDGLRAATGAPLEFAADCTILHAPDV